MAPPRYFPDALTASSSRMILASTAMAPLNVCNERVDVHLLDFGIIFYHCGDFEQQFLEMPNVHGRLPPVSLKKAIGPYLLDHCFRILSRERHDPEGDILEDLHQRSPEAEHEHRSELRILVHPDHELQAGGRHLLNGHPCD